MTIALITLLVIAIGIGLVAVVLRSEKLRERFVLLAFVACAFCLVFGSFIFLSFVEIDQDKVGHIQRRIGGKPLPEGRIIALEGERGPLAEVLSPGLVFKPLIRVIYKVEQLPLLEVLPSECGILMAVDGQPLRNDQLLASEWSEQEAVKMLDARYFLTTGNGQKGPQLTVLRPGSYRLNRYLFKTTNVPVTVIEVGQVGVVKSNVKTTTNNVLVVNERARALSTQVVDKGQIGVWNTPLYPGVHYINPLAYSVVIINTTMKSWEYKGGFTRRIVDIEVGQDGKLIQTARQIVESTPSNAADQALVLRVEGWEVYLELRVVTQVTPENAPLLAASVGTLQQMEDSVLTPAVRSIIRNVTGTTDQKSDQISTNRDNEVVLGHVLSLQNRRASLEAAVFQVLAKEIEEYGVTLREVRFGDPVTPPELLLPAKRKQLAGQLVATYQQEKLAQDERVKAEQSRAMAEQQTKLVESEIKMKAAENEKMALRLQGEGEKEKLLAISLGQKAQSEVLGKEAAFRLAIAEMAIKAAKESPGIVKVPLISVTGNSSGLDGAASIIGGASNLGELLSIQSSRNSTNK